MKNTQAFGGALLFLLCGGCQAPPAAQGTPAGPAMPNLAVERNANAERWERSRQCAEQAEKVAKRLEAESRQTDAISFTGWENHYSVKFERCFVRTTYHNRRPVKGDPLRFEELGDAFENRVLAMAPVGSQPFAGSPYCRVFDGPTEEVGNCAAARAYIDDRMNK